jgi:hypothetical protein
VDLHRERGELFWVHTAYSYVVPGTSVGLLAAGRVRAARGCTGGS